MTLLCYQLKKNYVYYLLLKTLWKLQSRLSIHFKGRGQTHSGSAKALSEQDEYKY